MMDTTELKKAAEAATPGPWECSDKHDGRFWHIHSGNQAIGSTHAAGKQSGYANLFEANAKFIAAANPAAVLALIAENDRLKREEKNDKIAYKAAIERQEELRIERDQLKDEVAIGDRIITERDRLLAAIPECGPHGQCVPHAIEWVERMKDENEALRKALTTIREESHDIGACECAADALVDSRKVNP
jgi:hypothetical protein